MHNALKKGLVPHCAVVLMGLYLFNLVGIEISWHSVPHCSVVPMGLYLLDLVGIEISWHSTKGGSKIAGVERVSVAKQMPNMDRKNGEE